MDATRRKFLLSSLLGAGGIGLRALATGIPVSVLATLANPRTARADDAAPTCASPQYIFLCTSGGGDPVNANVPGTYDNPNFYHSNRMEMAATPITFGTGKTVSGAKVWSTLAPDVLARMAVFHTATYTNSHGDLAKVNRLQGAVQRQEMTVSLFSKNIASCLKTIQDQPMVLSNNLITFKGAAQPVLSPQSLASVLASPSGALGDLQKIRDKNLDELNALFKSSGTLSQRTILDQYALSQTQARNLSQDLLSDLGSIRGGSRQDQNTAAAVLFKMNVSPVAVGNYSFGGDNHGDNGLNGETQAHIDSIAGITDFMAKLTKYGLRDQVTMSFQNVFGRTMKVEAHEGTIDGRNHNSNHHASILIGAPFKGGVYGAVKETANGYDSQATGINSTTGAGDDGGDIKYEDTFASVGKTFGIAVGVTQAIIDDQITKGKVITAALK